jgi:RNA polymerase-binding transcription factor DksA
VIDPQAPPDTPESGDQTVESWSPAAESVPDGGSEPDRPAADEPPVVDAERSPLDLERVSADLDGVEAALDRLDEGTYWTDEVTGEPIPDDVLAASPVARRSEVAD